MPLNRREFLGPLFAAPIFIASGAWVPRGHGAREAESPLEDGLAFMRRTGVLGAVIVVPRSPKGRRQLGRALHRLADPVSDPRTGVRAEGDAWVDIGRGDRESLAVMTSVAIICLERRDAKARFEAPGCIIAIDEEARPLRSIDEFWDDEPIAWRDALMTLVLGPDHLHLRDRVQRLRSGFDASHYEKVLSFVDTTAKTHWDPTAGPSPATTFEAFFDQAVALLGPHPMLRCQLALALLGVAPRAVSALQVVLEMRRRDAERLPFGCILPDFRRTSCSDNYEFVDQERFEKAQMMLCGLAFPSKTGGRYLRFLTELKKR